MRISKHLISVATLSLLFACATLLTGCPFAKNEDAVQATPGGQAAQGKLGFSKTVYPFVRTNCVQCHGNVQIPYFANAHIDTAYALAYGLVNFAEVPSSKFVSKVKDGHCGAACNSDGRVMIDLITEWRTYYGSKVHLPGAPVDRGNFFTQMLPIPPMPAGCTPNDVSRANQDHNLIGSPDPVTPGATTLLADNVTVVEIKHSICWIKMIYPLSQVQPALDPALSRAYFTVDLAYENFDTGLGPASYVYKNPRLISPDAAIYVHDIKTLVNTDPISGLPEYHPNYGPIYQNVDAIVQQAKFKDDQSNPGHVPPPITFCNPILPPFPQSIPYDPNCVPEVNPMSSTGVDATGIVSGYWSNNPAPDGTIPTTGPDTIGFSFEYIQKSTITDCKSPTVFESDVFRPIEIGALLCLNCHRQNGQVTTAGQRFNMDPTDAMYNPRGMTDVCQKFLERSIFSAPETSPIVIQPEKGMNGMPAQLNFDDPQFKNRWINWIRSECQLANPSNPGMCK